MDFNKAISSQAQIVKSQSHEIMVSIGEQKRAIDEIVKSINEMNVQNELTIQEADKISQSSKMILQLSESFNL